MIKYKKNILIMIPSLGRGGAERQVSVLTKNLKSDFEIDILVKNLNSGIKYKYYANIININHKAGSNILIKFCRYIKNLFFVFNARHKKNYFKVISFMEEMNTLNILTNIRSQKSILCVRCYPSELLKGKSLIKLFYKLTMKVFYNKSELIIAQTVSIKNDLIKRFRFKEKKIEVIPNLFELSSIKNASNEQKINSQVMQSLNKSIIFSNLGQLIQRKGQSHLIRILEKIKKDCGNVKLFIIGKGDMKFDLINLSNSLGLKVFVEDRDLISDSYDVYFWKDTDNPFYLLKISDIYIHAAYYEGFPNVIIEAMACSLPIISSDCLSGPREILAPSSIRPENQTKAEYHEFGLLLPSFNETNENNKIDNYKSEKIWAEAITNFINNKQNIINYSQKSFTRCEDFSSSKIIKKWKILLQN
jgi:glycosyltransferase involved in cell wall biosynthesis